MKSQSLEGITHTLSPKEKKMSQLCYEMSELSYRARANILGSSGCAKEELPDPHSDMPTVSNAYPIFHIPF